VYNAHVLKGTYLGLGYGKDMNGVDMVAWEAGTNKTTSTCQDLYAVSETRPNLVTKTSYNTTSIVEDGDFINFVSTRLATPAAGASDTYVIKLGESNVAVWAFGQYDIGLDGDLGL